MLNDCHLHTSFSSDSDEKIENYPSRACDMGMSRICITDHYDYGYPGPEYQLDTEGYWQALRRTKEAFAGRIEVGFGLEMGLHDDPKMSAFINSYMESQAFDVIIGSVHLLDGKDPFYREQISGEDEDMYRRYFAFTLSCLEQCRGFQTMGHLDYVVRYGYRKAESYHPEAYTDLLDPILEKLVAKGIALEVNTAGLRKGLGFPNPHPAILRRYRELGGEMVTVGSDAHRAGDMGYGFDTAQELLRQAGFRYVTEFREKKPYFVSIAP